MTSGTRQALATALPGAHWALGRSLGGQAEALLGWGSGGLTGQGQPRVGVLAPALQPEDRTGRALFGLLLKLRREWGHQTPKKQGAQKPQWGSPRYRQAGRWPSRACVSPGPQPTGPQSPGAPRTFHIYLKRRKLQCLIFQVQEEKTLESSREAGEVTSPACAKSLPHPAAPASPHLPSGPSPQGLQGPARQLLFTGRPQLS